MQAKEGIGLEFIFIICAVVGGCLLTGGYGSVIGTFFGACMLGMVQLGIIDSQWDSNWTYTFQGAILFAAVLLNTVDPQPRAEGPMSARAAPARGRRDLEVLRQRRRAEGHHDARERRRGDLHPRRQRRRQVELHQDPLGRPPAGRGAAARRRRGGAASARRATRARSGIATVYQDLAMVPLMSIWRNFFLGAEPRKGIGPLQWFDAGDGEADRARRS